VLARPELPEGLQDPMTDQPTGALVGAESPSGALQGIGIAAVFLGVAALAAGAFVFSYPGIHAFALQAGVSARLAKLYPLLADAMLVVTLAAVLSLRGAGLPTRMLAWCELLLLLAAAATADAMHAAGRSLPARPASVTAAVLPWVLVLLAFGLLLAMLRRSWRVPVAPRDAGLSIFGAAQEFGAPAPTGTALTEALRAGATPVLAEAVPVQAETRQAETRQAEARQAEARQAETGGEEPADEGAEPEPADGPVFYRVRSSPTPPAG
jgi:Protein of unknown function (DUF2637)